MTGVEDYDQDLTSSSSEDCWKTYSVQLLYGRQTTFLVLFSAAAGTRGVS